jgi:flagellar hook assembly protein FlgD
MNEPGYVANVTIYDAGGRPVRVLQRNTTIAASGSFRWDGLNDKQQRVATGNYIVLFEAFNLQGKKQAFKKGVTVARKF